MKTGRISAFFWLLMLLLSVRAPLAESPVQEEQVARLEHMTRQWIDLQIERVRETQSWEAERERLDREIQLVRKQREQLLLERDELASEKAGHDQDTGQLLLRRDALDSILRGTRALLDETAADIQQALQSLPAGMQADFEPAVRRLNQTETDRIERLRIILEASEELERLQNGIHVRSIILPPASSGRREEMDAVFIGTSAGFAVSRDDQRALAGRQIGGEWIWQDAASHAPAIREAITMARRESTPRLLRLPLPAPERRLP